MPSASSGAGARVRARLLNPTASLALLIVVLAIGLGIFAPGFASLGNFVDLIEGSSVTAIMAVGLFVVLVAGGIDISFAATASVAQYAAAYAATQMNLPMPAAIAVGLLTGTLLGALNALLIHRLRATSIIITISTMSLYFALLMFVTKGESIYGLPSWWSDPIVLFEFGGDADSPVRITLPIAIMLAVVALTAFVMNRTALGRQVFAFGGNPEAAHRAGIRLGTVQMFAYGYLGFMAALAGLVQAHRVGEAVPNALVGGELFVLAAVVLGGASLTGGRGSVGGVLLGVLLLAMLRNGLNLLGISSYFFPILLGIVILVSATATGLKTRAPSGQLAGRLGDSGNGSLLILLAVLWAGFALALPGRFATADTLSAMLLQLPELGLLALAMLLPLLSGGINLSIVASTNMAALAMALVLTGGLGIGTEHPATNIACALVLGCVLCLIVGMLIGYLVATVNAHPILVTLGSMSIISGICVWLTSGKPISGFPEAFQRIGSAGFLGVPLPFWIFTLAAIVVSLYLTHTRHGIAVYMVGSNLEATRYSGVDTRRVLIGVYAISTLLCWVAAILMMARFNSASADYAQSYLLVTVLAAILGGVDPFGGFGKVSGLFIALLILQVISSGLNLLGVNPQLTQAMWGATMIFVMAARLLVSMRKSSSEKPAAPVQHLSKELPP